MLTYLLLVGISLSALGRVTGARAYRVCLLIGAIFLCASGCAAGGGRFYARARTPLAIALRIAFVLLHNYAIVVSEGPRRKMTTLPSWTMFWATRTGPINCLILNLATGIPRGPALGGMLAAQMSAIALTQRAACFHLLRATPEFSYYYSRVADWLDRAASVAGAAVLGGVGGGSGGVGGGARAGTSPPPLLTPPALRTCCTLAGRQVMVGLYLGVCCLTWAAAPAAGGAPARRRRRRSPGGRGRIFSLDALLIGAIVRGVGALLAWWAIVAAFPRPPECPGTAAEVAWRELVAMYP